MLPDLHTGFFLSFFFFFLHTGFLRDRSDVYNSLLFRISWSLNGISCSGLNAGLWVSLMKSLSPILHWIHTYCSVSNLLSLLCIHHSIISEYDWKKKQQRQLYLEVTGRKSSLLNSLKWALSQVLELVSSLVVEGDNLYLIFISWITITLLSLGFHLMENLLFCEHCRTLREVTTCLVIHM